MKSVLITGGNGYIGSYLADSLAHSGCSVLKTSRRSGTGNVRVMDLLDLKSINNICEGVSTVIHTANIDERLIQGNERDALLANSFAARQLYLDAVKHGASRFIYLSTFHVYGKSSGNIDENTVCSPISDYGLTHLFAEQYLAQLTQKHSLPVGIIRLTNGIGIPPSGCDKWYLIVNDCCKAAVEKQVISLRSSGIQKRDFVAIKDVCAAIELLLSYPPEKKMNLFNVSSQKSVSMRRITEITAETYKTLTGSEVRLDIPDKKPGETAEELFVSSEKLRALGWEPKSTVQSVIREILESLI